MQRRRVAAYAMGRVGWRTSPVVIRNVSALALVVGGLVLLRTAPLHRPDLIVWAVLAMAGGAAWRPWAGAAVIGATLPLYFFPRDAIGPLSFAPHGAVLIATWLGIVARAIGARLWTGRTDVRLPVTGYDLPLLVFLSGGLLSLLVTEYPRLSAREMRATLLEPVAFFWLLSATRAWRTERAALIGLLVGAVVTAAVALGLVALGLGGTEAEGVRRAQSWYPSPNHLALLLDRALPFLLALAFVEGVRRPMSGWTSLRTILPWLAIIVVGLALMATFSLGGWLGMAAAVGVMLLASGHARAAGYLALFTVMALVLLGVLGAAGVVPERLNPLRATSGMRIELWFSSLQMVRDHPFLGVGLDNFVYQYQQVYLREGGAAEPNLAHPHNWILHVWLQCGWLGLVGFVWLVERVGHKARVALAVKRSWSVVGALGAMAATLVHGLIDNSYFLPDLAFAFWLMLALVEAESRDARDPERPVEGATVRMPHS